MEKPEDAGAPTVGKTGGLRGFLGRHERAVFVLLLVVGLLARVAWVSQNNRLGPLICESYQASLCFARTGGICDTYLPGQGATATATPVMPVLDGLVYRALGAGSRPAEMVLTAFSLAVL